MAGKRRRAAKKVTGAIRDRRCVELRIEGYTLQEIADQVGLKTPGAVHKAITRTLTRTTQPAADDLRAIELARLEQMQKKLWEKFSRKQQPLDEMLKIHRALLRLSARRAGLLGLDAPVKHRVEADVAAKVDARLREESAEMTNEQLVGALLEDPELREHARGLLDEDTTPDSPGTGGAPPVAPGDGVSE